MAIAVRFRGLSPNGAKTVAARFLCTPGIESNSSYDCKRPESYSPPMRAPFSATERFINKTTGTSASINIAKIQKQSK